MKDQEKPRSRRQGELSSTSDLQRVSSLQAAAALGSRARRCLVSKTAGELGGLDLLGNNAGIENRVSLIEMPLERMRRVAEC